MKKTEQDYLEELYPCSLCRTSQKLFFDVTVSGFRIGCAGCGCFTSEWGKGMATAVMLHNVSSALAIDKLKTYHSWELVYELKEEIQNILDLARTGLPLPQYTEEEWAKHRLNMLAAELSGIKRKILKITGV